MSETERGARPRDFLREIIDEHLRENTYAGRVATRFPPEPNGYLHIGHAKSICLNFGLAEEFGGTCNLRMDDTNPTTENPEYVASIQEDVRWLGFSWSGLFHASDHFEKLYAFAQELIRVGKAYVCSQTEAEMRASRGSILVPGTDSPFRTRTAEESLGLFARMRAGEFPDGAHTLRARIDMSAANMKLRDPPLYRIRRAHHYRTGDAWCIYPLYDFAHCLSDALEGITHSICTLEFENNRDLYDFILDALPSVTKPRPHQYEFARLNITYTVLSKRKLLELVNGKHVSGWDDPRMPTLSGLRRRGYTPEGIRSFCDLIGVAKSNSMVEVELLESCIRDDLNRRSPRVLCVLDPLEVTLTNLAEGEIIERDAPYFPPSVGGEGTRALALSRTIYIEREDFSEQPPPGWHRLAPGGSVRLRHAFVVRCDEVVKGPGGEVIGLRATLDRSPDAKAKGTIHWVDAATALDVEVRLYDRLFAVEKPDDGDADYKTHLSPTSLVVTTGAKIEPSVQTAAPGARFQLERHGFFCVDSVDSSPSHLVLNRTVPLKDSWARKQTADAPPVPRETATPATATAETAAVPRPKTLSPEAEALRSRYSLGAEEAHIIVSDSALNALFEASVKEGAAPIAAATLLGTELPRALKLAGKTPADVTFGARQIKELASLLTGGTLTSKHAREVLSEMLSTGKEPLSIVEARGFRQVFDEGEIGAAVDALIAAQAHLVERFRGGEAKLFGVLMGELMKATGGKANAKLAGELLRKKMSLQNPAPRPPRTETASRSRNLRGALFSRGRSGNLPGLTSDGATPPRAIGRYLLFGELAAGGMASVHLGRLVGPVGFSRTVAVKRLHPQLARDPEGVSAFLDEARLTARVQHPNVAQTLDVVEMPGELFLVMEYVRGETLSRLVRAVTAKGETPPLRIVTSIITGALYGLHAAHEARSERGVPLGIVHRDVSPQNVIVGVDGVARVLDFGVAKAIGRVSSTSDGQIKGKISYMPPEQLSSGQVDRRTDVYATAVVMWEALTARRLFEGDTQGVVIGRILRGDVEPPTKYVPSIPAAIEAIVMRGLALDPDQRFSTALDMATELERVGNASPREVGVWVEEIAGPVLAQREAMVAEVESASFSGISAEGLRRSAQSTSGAAALEPLRENPGEAPSTGTGRSLSAFASSPALPSLPSTLSPPPPQSRRRPVLVIAGLATLAMLAAGVIAFRRGGSDDERASSVRSAPSLPVSAASSPMPDPPAPAASVAPSASSPAATSSAVPSPPPRPTTRVPVKPVAGRDCNPPFRVDADGIRHMKPECF